MATDAHATSTADLPPSGPVYKVYKRRFWGLAQLVLLNIMVSWDVRFFRCGPQPRNLYRPRADPRSG